MVLVYRLNKAMDNVILNVIHQIVVMIVEIVIRLQQLSILSLTLLFQDVPKDVIPLM